MKGVKKGGLRALVAVAALGSVLGVPAAAYAGWQALAGQVVVFVEPNQVCTRSVRLVLADREKPERVAQAPTYTVTATAVVRSRDYPNGRREVVGYRLVTLRHVPQGFRVDQPLDAGSQSPGLPLRYYRADVSMPWTRSVPASTAVTLDFNLPPQTSGPPWSDSKVVTARNCR